MRLVESDRGKRQGQIAKTETSHFARQHAISPRRKKSGLKSIRAYFNGSLFNIANILVYTLLCLCCRPVTSHQFSVLSSQTSREWISDLWNPHRSNIICGRSVDPACDNGHQDTGGDQNDPKHLGEDVEVEPQRHGQQYPI